MIGSADRSRHRATRVLAHERCASPRLGDNRPEGTGTPLMPTSSIPASSASTSPETTGRREAKVKAHAFALPICLAALAGFVDATGFITFHGLFVSFMSGNSTEGAVDAVAGGAHLLAIVRAIGVFVGGVTLGELVGSTSKRWSRPLVLLLEALCLWSAVGVDHLGGSGLVAALLGLAMGVQNASMHKADGSNVALTYVTGTLVHVGRTLAGALRGAHPWGDILPFAGLWVGLVCGGVAGALVTRHDAGIALIVAATVGSALTAWTAIVAAARLMDDDA